MCVVIDINTLSSVFDSGNQSHHDFKPICDWIIDGKGKIVYGGSKYIEELSRTKYIGLFKEFKSKNKAVYIPDDVVDKKTLEVSKKISHRDFDDQHVVGLLLASRCKIVCSLDESAYRFFRHKDFFGKASNKPKIYRSKNNTKLLIDKNIASVCQPCTSSTKTERITLTTIWKNLLRR